MLVLAEALHDQPVEPKSGPIQERLSREDIKIMAQRGDEQRKAAQAAATEEAAAKEDQAKQPQPTKTASRK